MGCEGSTAVKRHSRIARREIVQFPPGACAGDEHVDLSRDALQLRRQDA